MSNCKKEFDKFISIIDLSKTQKNYLMKARDAIRTKIRNYFKNDLEFKIPKFYQQGSFAIKTVINPIEPDEYDVDDGIYLQNLEDEINNWNSPEEVHDWIYKAVENHTSQKPENKKTCIRVFYKKDDKNEYHVDLPIYGIYDEKMYLACIDGNSSEWKESDPKALTDWFRDKIKNNTEQLRTIVKLIKAWRDYQKIDFPSIAITVLVGEYYAGDENIENSLKKTLENIITKLENNKKVERPIFPNDDLLSELSETEIDTVIEKIVEFKDLIENAINSTNKDTSIKKLKKCFGDRFPDKIESNDSTNENKDLFKNIAVTKIKKKAPQPWMSL
jgi:hypothetical protein